MAGVDTCRTSARPASTGGLRRTQKANMTPEPARRLRRPKGRRPRGVLGAGGSACAASCDTSALAWSVGLPRSPDADELHFKDERRVGWDRGAGALRAVAEVGRNHQ